jgi:hypothetical protein
MTKPLYFYNGTTFELVGPTTPQSPIAYQTSAPTAPATGDLWIDSDGDVDTYNRQLTRYYFVATAGQTTISGVDANGLTLAYVAGSEAVYVNGALQVRGQDYTATNGTSVVMSSGLAVNDVVEIFAYTAFTVANAYTKAETDSIVTALGGTNTAWTSYTPTWTGISSTGATSTGAYKQIGKTVFFQAKYVVGSSGISVTGAITPSLPVTKKSTSIPIISGLFIDAGTGYRSTLILDTSLYAVNSSVTYADAATPSNTIPFTWAVNDEVRVSGVYEAS